MQNKMEATPKYRLEPDGSFMIEDYQQAKLFASFLPGIAGKNGIPIWAFYVNRGKCLSGFGIRNKDGAIQEFVPADKAPWYTAWRGFRTFLKIMGSKQTTFYEPFRVHNDNQTKINTRLKITPSDIIINEINHDLGIEVKVSYFTLPEERIGGLYRRTEIVNHRKETIRFQLVDGLAVMIPSGMNNYLMKNMGATIRAWMNVSSTTGVPFHKLSFLPDDVPELLKFDSGNFHLGYTIQGNKLERLQPIYDRTIILAKAPITNQLVLWPPNLPFQPIR